MTNKPSSIDPHLLGYYQAILEQTRSLDAVRRHLMTHIVVTYSLEQGDVVDEKTGIINRVEDKSQPKTKDTYFEMDL